MSCDAAIIRTFVAASALWCLSVAGALAQHAIVPYAAVPFAPAADVAYLSSALETGNPAAGPSTVILKAAPGCVVPWHWHTAQEQLMVVSGDVMAEMTGQPPTLPGAGGLAVMAGNMARQFTCQGRDACVMFVTFDRAYDINGEAVPEKMNYSSSMPAICSWRISSGVHGVISEPPCAWRST